MVFGRMEDFTIDQFAGATALILGSVGGLLMIIWKSRCACRCRIGCSDKCYIFDCERSPPPDNNNDSDNEDAKKSPTKKNKPEKPQKPLQKEIDKDIDNQTETLIPNDDVI